MPRMREAMRSGWNGSSPSSFSPTPANLIGLPVTWRTESAAPPRASPSSLVSTTPVSGSASPNAFATLTASWPCIESTTNSVSVGCERRVQPGDLLHHRLVDREPPGGVDDQHVVVVRACVLERRARDVDRLLADRRREEIDAHLRGERAQLLDRGRPVDVAQRRAASFFRISSFSSFASLPAVVVLPEPCSPAIRMTAGGGDARLSPAFSPPISRGQLAVHDADQRLARRQAADHLLAERLLAHARDEILDHRQRDVGFEQRHAHLAQGVLRCSTR